MHARQRETQEWRRAAKRMIDIVVAASSLVLLSPFLLAIAVVVKLTSPGPVLYSWRVVGKNGTRFTGYKFRTMIVNADEVKKDLWHFNERNGPTFKMKNDPRVTPIGRILYASRGV